MNGLCVGRFVRLCGLLLACFGVAPAAAQITSCHLPLGATMNVVTYVGQNRASADSPLCTRTGALTSCRLAGWLYQPSGPMPFPAIVINHASGNVTQMASVPGPSRTS